MYNVFLGSLELYCVEDFEETSKRQIAVHSTLGAGEVPIYNDKELRSWKMTCELSNYRQPMHHVFTPASDIFAVFEGWLAAGEEQRLVVVSDSITLSEMVMLKSYRKNETTQGVFDVTLELTEHKEVSVRTADIPFIQRPGKIPPLPPVKPGNPAKLTGAEDTDAAFVDWQTKMVVDKYGIGGNLNQVYGDTTPVFGDLARSSNESKNKQTGNKREDFFQKALDAISSAFDRFKEKNGSTSALKKW